MGGFVPPSVGKTVAVHVHSVEVIARSVAFAAPSLPAETCEAIAQRVAAAPIARRPHLLHAEIVAELKRRRP